MGDMMNGTYETSREQFNKIVAQYKEYLHLYRFFNHGKTEGATPFNHFYLVRIFYSYHDNEFKHERGY